jgi:hypothetical protein
LNCTRAGHGRLGHQEGGADLARQQRLEPFFLMLFRAVAHKDFHIAGVGRGAVEHFAGPGHPAHFFRQRGVIGIGQAGALFAVRQEQIPQAGGLGLLLQLLDDGGDLPAIGSERGHLSGVDRLVGIDMLVHEGAHPRLIVFAEVGIFKIHGDRPPLGGDPDPVRRTVLKSLSNYRHPGAKIHP